jgi:hypothetical protein
MTITEGITNPIARAAIDALQKGDKRAWEPLFAEGAQLFDDGHPRSLKRFSDEALGHERFRSIERVENDGLSLEGSFHSDTWGEFRTYFRFTLDPSGKITRLDIGQAG